MASGHSISFALSMRVCSTFCPYIYNAHISITAVLSVTVLRISRFLSNSHTITICWISFFQIFSALLFVVVMVMGVERRWWWCGGSSDSNSSSTINNNNHHHQHQSPHSYLLCCFRFWGAHTEFVCVGQFFERLFLKLFTVQRIRHGTS